MSFCAHVAQRSPSFPLPRRKLVQHRLQVSFWASLSASKPSRDRVVGTVSSLRGRHGDTVPPSPPSLVVDTTVSATVSVSRRGSSKLGGRAGSSRCQSSYACPLPTLTRIPSESIQSRRE